ncbi:GRF1-interacting factor [Sarracenia purpurea var. burkii]
MQQSPHSMRTPPQFPPTANTITTEEVQKYLDENKRLILSIMENQNLGNFTEVAQYQAQLQKNLTFLAAIADTQPQGAPMPSQATLQLSSNLPDIQKKVQAPPPQPVVQQEQHHQQPPATTAEQQRSGLNPKLPFQLNPFQSRDQQHQLLQQQELMQGQMGMMTRAGVNAGVQDHRSSTQTGIGSSGFWGEARGSKQDLLETGSGGGTRGNSASASGRWSGETDSQL